MNEWLRDYLGASPDQRFYEWDLLMNCPDFEALRAEGLLTRDLEAEKSDFLITKWGRCLDLVRIDGAIFGVDTEDCEDRYVEVDPRELIQYRFNWEPWLRKVHEVNGLGGESSWLHPDLAFLGEKIYEGRRLGIVLGFFSQRDEAMDMLLSLPPRMPSKYDIAIVTTLIPRQLPQQDIASLERLGVYVVVPIDCETLMIECPRLQPKRRDAYSAVIACTQEADYDRYEYNCRLPVRLTGKITKAGNNEILVGDTPVEVGDVPFLLFLRLVLELRRNKSGIVSRVDLRSEGYFGEGTDDHAINRLRNCFIRALGNLGPKDFIETTYRRKTVRVSVHPDLVSWDAEKLLDHDDERVKALVRQLVQTAEADSSSAT
jgi:hypothetical protein